MNQNKTQLKQPLMAQYKKTPELSASSVFKLRPEELQLFFYREHMKKPSEDNAGERRETLVIIEKVGWTQGLLASLATDAETGIIGDVKDLQRRKKFFGQNKISLPTVRSFWSILYDQIDEFYVVLLLILATIMLLLSFFLKGANTHLIEAISVYFAVAFAAMIQTLCDWGKEQQFLNLRSEIVNQKCTVLRGQYGTTQSVLASNLVVGDVIMLEAGDRVPADCLLIEEMDMKVDQRMYNLEDDQSVDYAEKQCSYGSEAGDLQNPDACLLQGSIVMSGSGKAVVLCVGKQTLREVELGTGKEKAEKLKIDEQETPYQQKLKVLSEVIGFWAQVMGWGSLVIFSLVWLLTCMFSSSTLMFDIEGIMALVDYAIISVALLAVCIPEGMPLVISMGMAFSVESLKTENLLIKNLDALETSGQLIDILTGKTATLTTGDMRVGHLNIIGQSVNVEDPEVNNEVLTMLQECLILNTDAQMQMGENTFEPHGSPVDVGLMQMLIQQHVCVQDKLIDRERNYTLEAQIPFSSFRKRRTVAYRLSGDNSDVVRVVVKGAPEILIPLCDDLLDQNNEPAAFDNREEFLENTVAEDIAKTGMKPLTIAYRDFTVEQFEELKEANGNFESEESREVFERELTHVATVGLIDNLRDDVDVACEALSQASTNVRIVSGDHKESVISVALSLGILAKDEDIDQKVMSGEALKEELKTWMEMTDDTEEGRGSTWVFRGKDEVDAFKKSIMGYTCVVYRADPEVKHMFTAAIRAAGSIVGVTGEGLNDARALSEASVGFAMGEDGCQAAKEHADIILTDDNFLSVVNAIRWGRNIQDNSRKFVQYQLTVNVSCLVFVVFSIVTLGFSPFCVVQLLWINLVMDVLAAIAYATEHPHPSELRKERIKKKDKIITPLIWRAVTSQAIYQLLVMIVLLFWGPAMFGIKYEFYPAPKIINTGGLPTFHQQHLTLLFQTFMMMNLFNMINCRVLGKMPTKSQMTEDLAGAAERREMNAFTRIFDNWWFLIVLLGEVNLQFAMVQYSFMGSIFLTTPLTFGMHLTAFLLGAGSLGVAALVKLTPEKLLDKFPQIEETEDYVKNQRNRLASIDSQIRSYQQ